MIHHTSLYNFSHWYCSVDVSPSRYLVAAGRNNGIVRLMSTEGREVRFFWALYKFVYHKNSKKSDGYVLREHYRFISFHVPALQIRRGKRDNLGIIFHTTPLKHVVAHH